MTAELDITPEIAYSDDEIENPEEPFFISEYLEENDPGNDTDKTFEVNWSDEDTFEINWSDDESMILEEDL